METVETKLDLKQIKKDLLITIKRCSERGLLNSTKWLSEMNYSISHIKLEPHEYPILSDTYEDIDSYLVAKSFMELKEYDRCSYFTEGTTDFKSKFLNLYSKYLSIEKKKLDSMTNVNCPPDPTENEELRDLRKKLNDDKLSNKLDGYCLYLYGVVLKKLDLNSLALDIFVDAINEEPSHWGAWQELALLVPDRNTLTSLRLPEHWLKPFFLAHVYLEQLNNDEAVQIYYDLQAQGFEKSTYITSQLAIAYHNRRELEKAISTFKDLMLLDPYRLDNLDTYSNLLYVREMKTELAALAHTAVGIDKYRVETCCVIGNYYSLRSEHQKAVLYFQRALKLNPLYLSAWTLMGHEYMEMKNTNAAIQSYRQAIDVNRRDYRAWYGLGQTYEILKMPFYSMYYYKQAQQLRPNDSRMVIALGETYEKLEKFENALKCYYKACSVGDIEGTALIKLARLYERLAEHDNAAAAYTEFCLKEEEQHTHTLEGEGDIYSAFHYLAGYHFRKGQLDDAYTYAYKCLEYDETKEYAKAILKSIAARRAEDDMELQVVRILPSEGLQVIEMSAEVSSMDIVFSPVNNNE